jgi:hypothetical protein
VFGRRLFGDERSSSMQPIVNGDYRGGKIPITGTA